MEAGIVRGHERASVHPSGDVAVPAESLGRRDPAVPAREAYLPRLAEELGERGEPGRSCAELLTGSAESLRGCDLSLPARPAFAGESGEPRGKGGESLRSRGESLPWYAESLSRCAGSFSSREEERSGHAQRPGSPPERRRADGEARFRGRAERGSSMVSATICHR